MINIQELMINSSLAPLAKDEIQFLRDNGNSAEEGSTSRASFYLRNYAFGKEVMYPQLQTNNELTAEACEIMDEVITEVCKKELRLLQVLRDAGLVRSIDASCAEAIASIITDYKGKAIITMDCADEPNMVSATAEKKSTQLPYSMEGYKYRSREVCMWRRHGISFDDTLGRAATRSVAEAIEGALLSGSSFNQGINQAAKEYTPCKGPWISEDGKKWLVTTQDIRCEIQNMLQELLACCKTLGDVIIAFPCNFESTLESYCDQTCNKTLGQSILELNRVSSIEILPTQDDSCITIFEADQRTLRVVEGMPIQTIPVANMIRGCVEEFRTMGIIVPEVRPVGCCCLVIKGQFGPGTGEIPKEAPKQKADAKREAAAKKAA